MCQGGNVPELSLEELYEALEEIRALPDLQLLDLQKVLEKYKKHTSRELPRRRVIPRELVRGMRTNQQTPVPPLVDGLTEREIIESIYQGLRAGISHFPYCFKRA